MSQVTSKAPQPPVPPSTPPTPPPHLNDTTHPATFMIEGRVGKVSERSGISVKSNKPWSIRFAQIQTWGETFEVGFEDGPAGDDLFRRLRSGTVGAFYGTFSVRQNTIRLVLTSADVK